MIEFNWIISAMENYPKMGELENVVFQVHYRRQAVEVVDGKEYFAETFSVANVPAPSEDFTPYEELTFAQVCGWLEDVLNVGVIDAALTAQINEQKKPTKVIAPLPWENMSEALFIEN